MEETERILLEVKQEQLLCAACMSKDRRLSKLRTHTTNLFIYLLGHYAALVRLDDMLLCWECCAVLKRFCQFQHQVQAAQVALKQSLTPEINNIQCLSTMITTHFEVIECSPTLTIENTHYESEQNSTPTLSGNLTLELIKTEGDPIMIPDGEKHQRDCEQNLIETEIHFKEKFIANQTESNETVASSKDVVIDDEAILRKSSGRIDDKSSQLKISKTKIKLRNFCSYIENKLEDVHETSSGPVENDILNTNSEPDKDISGLDYVPGTDNSDQDMTVTLRKRKRKVEEKFPSKSSIIPDTNESTEDITSDEKDKATGFSNKSDKGTVLVANTSGSTKRVFDKKHACMYCKLLVSKLPRHLEAKHKNEEEVAKFMALPLHSTERKLILEKIRQTGNYIHNTKTITSGKGLLIPKRRPNDRNKNIKDYSPCKYCHGLYSKKYFFNHKKHCILRPEDEIISAKSGEMIPKSLEGHWQRNLIETKIDFKEKLIANSTETNETVDSFEDVTSFDDEINLGKNSGLIEDKSSGTKIKKTKMKFRKPIKDKYEDVHETSSGPVENDILNTNSEPDKDISDSDHEQGTDKSDQNMTVTLRTKKTSLGELFPSKPAIPDTNEITEDISSNLKHNFVTQSGKKSRKSLADNDPSIDIGNSSTTSDKQHSLQLETMQEGKLDKTNESSRKSDIDSVLIATTTRSTKRIFDKRHACMYCKLLVSKLPRHLEAKHKNEEEVAKFMALPLHSNERKLILEKIRQTGNYIHNSETITSGKGLLIPKKRSNDKNKGIKDYTPCGYCHGLYSRKHFYIHKKHCVLRPENEIVGAKSGKMSFPVAQTN